MLINVTNKPNSLGQIWPPLSSYLKQLIKGLMLPIYFLDYFFEFYTTITVIKHGKKEFNGLLEFLEMFIK